MHIFGEQAREKIPIKSLPHELQKSGLKPNISSVYIFYLCNVTSEKENTFFRNISTYDLSTWQTTPIKQLQHAVTNKNIK